MRQMFSLTTVYLLHHKFVFLLVVVFCLPFFSTLPYSFFPIHILLSNWQLLTSV